MTDAQVFDLWNAALVCIGFPVGIGLMFILTVVAFHIPDWIRRK